MCAPVVWQGISDECELTPGPPRQAIESRAAKSHAPAAESVSAVPGAQEPAFVPKRIRPSLAQVIHIAEARSPVSR